MGISSQTIRRATKTLRSLTARRVLLAGTYGDPGHFVEYEGHPLFIHEGGGVGNGGRKSTAKPKEPTAEDKIAHPDAPAMVEKMKSIEAKYKAKADKLDKQIEAKHAEVQQHLDMQHALRVAVPVMSERTAPSKYGGPTVQEHMDALEKKVDANVEEIQGLVSKKNDLAEAQRKEAFKTVVGDHARELGGNVLTSAKETGEEPQGLADMKKGVKAFKQMLGAGGQHEFWPDVKLTAIPKPKDGQLADNYNEQRSHAENNPFQPAIRMGHNAGAATTVHELGHIAELVSPKIKDAAHAFLDRRTAGLPVKKLSEITGQNYKDHEIASAGAGFVSPYVGKHYHLDLDPVYTGPKIRYATEVTSMGLEHMYRDPVAFAKADPDHFKFTYSVMHQGDNRASNAQH